jgi:hypothetical protein
MAVEWAGFHAVCAAKMGLELHSAARGTIEAAGIADNFNFHLYFAPFCTF